MSTTGPAGQQPIVVPVGGGKSLPRPDTRGEVTIKLSSDVTGGSCTIWESKRVQGDTGGPGVHSHPEFDEAFYVLAGEYEFSLGKKKVIASTGALVFLPRGTFHTFSSTGLSEGRLLAFAVPGGVEDFFEEMAVADHDVAAAVVGGKHGIVFVDPDRGR